jgi:capsular polysaccharide transport system permease protein
MSNGATVHHSEAPTGWLQSLLAGLRVQARIIAALMLREVLTRFKKQHLGYLWALLDPCLHIALWFFIFAFFRAPREFHDMTGFMFLATGIVAMYLLFLKVAIYVSGAVSAGKGLLRFPMIKQVDTVFARFFLEAATMIVISTILLATFVVLGFGAGPYDLPRLSLASACLLLLALGFGAFNGSLSLLFPAYSRFMFIIYRVIYFTSGAFFSVTNLPPDVQQIIAWNPVFNGVDQFRSAWSFTYEATLTSNSYVLAVAGGFFLASLLLDKRVLQVELGE